MQIEKKHEYQDIPAEGQRPSATDPGPPEGGTADAGNVVHLGRHGLTTVATPRIF